MVIGQTNVPFSKSQGGYKAYLDATIAKRPTNCLTSLVKFNGQEKLGLISSTSSACLYVANSDALTQECGMQRRTSKEPECNSQIARSHARHAC